MSKHHQILGIPSSASQQEIKQAYRKMVKLYHPDLNKSAEAEAKFFEVDEAYDYLTGKIKPIRKYINRQSNQPNRETEIEKRREKAKAFAKMRFEQYKQEHEAFMNSPKLYLYLFLLGLLAIFSTYVSYVLANVPIRAHEFYIEKKQDYPDLEFDYSTYGAMLIAIPFLYCTYRIFCEMKTLFQDQ